MSLIIVGLVVGRIVGLVVRRMITKAPVVELVRMIVGIIQVVVLFSITLGYRIHQRKPVFIKAKD